MDSRRVRHLIIGTGVAGLTAAIALAEAGHPVVLVTKDRLESGSSFYAQGGIASVWGSDDCPADHAHDTIMAGAGLCVPSAVDLLVREGPDAVRAVIEWGARFDRDGESLLRTREGGHGRRRILHANGDATGRELMRALRARIAREPRIEMLEGFRAVDLLIGSDGVVGAWGHFGPKRRPTLIVASRTLLACGGLGGLFRDTTNPAVVSGDGIVMAWAAGAAVADLEFIQFHPTGLVIPGEPRHLLTEVLRGEGAHLTTRSGDRFMLRYHPLAELAPRDIVVRAEVIEMQKTGDPFVLLDARHLGSAFLTRRFPDLEALLALFSLSLTRDPIPVAPAAHYTIGGVLTDHDGRTTLPGLYAAGEVACTGVHGANRLASNSLLECLVFGRRTARAMASDPLPRLAPLTGPPSLRPQSWLAGDLGSSVRAADFASRHLGVFRTGPGLAEATTVLDPALARRPADADAVVPARAVARTRWAACALVARFAEARRESRGAHFREDFPEPDPAWRFRQALTGTVFSPLPGPVA